MFRDLVTGRLEGKRVGRYDIIGNNNSVSLSQFNINKNRLLPCIGLCRPKRLSIVLGEVVRMDFSQSNNRSLLPTPSPSLIREGVQATHLLKGDSKKVLSKRQTIRLGTCHYALVAQSHNYPSPILPLPQGAGIMKGEKKSAFTLAEVLITLGIIGVVAAMTMPVLVTNFQKKRTVTQLKATYSILAQAFEHAKVDYGDMEYWGLDSIRGQTSGEQDIVKNVVETYFLPYIKPLKNYGITNFSNLGYWPIYNLDKSIDVVILGQDRYFITLSNGTIIGFSLDGHCDNEGTDTNGNWVCNSQWYYTTVYIVVDINGLQRPNTYGKDIFVMQIANNKFKFYSYSTSENDRNRLLQYCSKGSSENRMCGRLIQLDGWEIKYDW